MRAFQIKLGNLFFRHRNWVFPLLIAGSFWLTIAPATLFGSARAEEAKDGIAILIVMSGLVLRALVIGHRPIRRAGQKKTIHAAELFTDGLFSLCRNPLNTGNILVVLGIFLMHGGLLTFVIGTTAYLIIYAAMIRAEEQYLLQRFGQPYADYCARVPRWIPDLRRMGEALRDVPFHPRQVLFVEYTNIGIAAMALLAAEICEQVQNPTLHGRHRHVVELACMVGLTLVGIAAVRFAKKRRLAAA